MQLTIEHFIREYAPLGKLSATGFHALKCPLCHDHSDRMGIKFEHGEIGANCFNCGFAARYTEASGEMSKKFKTLLEAFSIPMDEIDKVLGQTFFNRNEEPQTITLESIKKKSYHTPTVNLPDDSYLLGTPGEHQEAQDEAYKYLHSRKLEGHRGPLYLSTNPRYANRLIIPFFRNNKLVYWQARSIDGSDPRYLNCEASKEAIIYGYDELNSWSKLPLWIVEGVIDAMSVDGVALIGSKINECKMEMLKKSKRELVFVIDQDENGLNLGRRVLLEGWKITFTEKNTDVNKSIQVYGKLWTLYTLVRNIPKNKFEAEMQLNLRCGAGKKR